MASVFNAVAECAPAAETAVQAEQDQFSRVPRRT
jgi:hypothetical protein